MHPIFDPLYGIEPAPDKWIWSLYQTTTLGRLRDISLSSVPSRMSLTGMASSRFEHSIGVSHLARVLAKRKVFGEFEDELIVASLLHDSASAPFSHTAEIFQHALTGQTHEEAVAHVLERQEIKQILTKRQIDPERVLALILGNHPELGSILAGSIDLDNLDNSARLARAFGAIRELPYQPEKLVKAYRITSQGLTLDSEYLPELLGWVRCRGLLYGEVLYSDAKLAPACMLYRVLESAFDQGILDKAFFELNESQALAKLLDWDQSNLIDDALHYRLYLRSWEQTWTAPNDKVNALMSDWRKRKLFADDIARRLRVKPNDVLVYAGYHKGYKSIHLPFSGEWSQACESLFRNSKTLFRLYVYLHPRLRTSSRRLHDAVDGAFEQIEGQDPGHSFV